MARPEQHKCLFCGEMFRPDPHNAGHQKYCSKPDCRKASKVASRRAWLAKPENKDYFRGQENVVRVQLWRTAHPGYWRRPRGQRAAKRESPFALQDLCLSQTVEIVEDSQSALQPALQDLWRDQPAVLIGFIAQFTGSALQEAMPDAALPLLCRTGNYAARGLADRRHAGL